MAKQNDEISSTEQLLALIREEEAAGIFPKGGVPAEIPETAKYSSIAKSFAFRANVTVGVDIGHTTLRLAKVRNLSGKKRELVDFAEVPFPPGITPKSSEFSDFLKASLRKFGGFSKKVSIWTFASSAQTEIRIVKIPKVPKKQLPNAVFWTLKKELPFDEKEAVFDFEIIGDLIEDGIPKMEAMACVTPRLEIERTKKLLSKAGFLPNGVTIVPFALQNLMRTGWVEIDATNLCCLYIGRGWSRIDVFSKNNLVLSRGVKTGIHSMEDSLREEIDARKISQPLEYVEMENPHASEPDQDPDIDPAQASAHRLLHLLCHEEASDIPLARQFNTDKVFEICLPAIERLVRQVERTISHFSLNFNNQPVNGIFLSGELSNSRRILKYFSDQLGIRALPIDPFGGGAERSQRPPPQSSVERNLFSAAVGLALSSNSLTPNFIFTHRDKEKVVNTRRFNRAVLLTCMFLVIACIGWFFRIENQADRKMAQIDRLQEKLASFQPRVDRDIIRKLAAQTRSRQQQLTALQKRYIGIAVLGETIRSTPADIRLISIRARLGNETPARDAPAKGKAATISAGYLEIDGLVKGDRQNTESVLAAYLISLKNTNIFKSIRVKDKKTEFYDNQPVLRFTAEADIT